MPVVSAVPTVRGKQRIAPSIRRYNVRDGHFCQRVSCAMNLRIYERFSRRMVAVLLLTLPLTVAAAVAIPSNNDLDTWLPQNSPARTNYEEFRRVFGAEDFLVIAFDHDHPDAPDEKLVEAVCVRLERLPGVQCCWSPARMRELMQNFGVPPPECDRRLQRLLLNGAGNRAGTVEDIQCELDYCRLGNHVSLLAGSPLFVTELDRLGSKKAGTPYFLATLGICLGLLFCLIREWKLTGLVFSLTLWTVNLTLIVLHLAGIEMNFLLASIPVLVMVLTMSVSVHYLHYYREALERGDAQPIGVALRESFWPAVIATATTCIGELSLSVSDIVTIRQFAYASAIGSVTSLVAGLGLTPALVFVCPTLPPRPRGTSRRDSRISTWIVMRARLLTAACLAATVLTCLGLWHMQSDMNVADFLPADSRVRQDYLRIERELARVDSMEAVVDFGRENISFVEKLARVREIDRILHTHAAVDQTLSLASFFPDPLPQNALELAGLLRTAQLNRGESRMTAENEQIWRISVRIRRDREQTRRKTIDELNGLLAGQPVVLTGMAALVEGTQQEIFDSFWESIALALVLVTLAMMIFLRSVSVGILAMIPNVAPLCWIYGLVGWLGWPVDVAMMLSGSIALGLSVDGTFHFLAHFRAHYDRTGSSAGATRRALLESGIPFVQATLTTCAAMLSLLFSPFNPTVRFGGLMMALMLAALIGDIVMLPALTRLWWSGRSPPQQQPEPVVERVAVRSAA
jgi:uncharacterized protein